MTRIITLTGSEVDLQTGEVSRDGSVIAVVSKNGTTLPVPAHIRGLVPRGTASVLFDGERTYVCLDEQSSKMWNDSRPSAQNPVDEVLLHHVPGLEELRSAYAQHEEYDRSLLHMLEDEHGCARTPKKPTSDLHDLESRYPLAALYIRAEGFSLSSNHHKSSAGARAMKQLSAGDVESARMSLENWIPDSRKGDRK